ncbi:MAG: Na(+)-translocating NADH-quinone reductase subunit A [Myxococcota bacterium]
MQKGLDLPIAGEPAQEIRKERPKIEHVALLGHDYPTMKPRMLVAEGDVVKRGQALFEDRKSEGIRFTAPGAGTVKIIHRGERRVFQSLVIALSEAEQAGEQKEDEYVRFEAYRKGLENAIDADSARALLQESGLWTALRMRPYSRVPGGQEQCSAIFVTAIDTAPLAPSPQVVLAGKEETFALGLRVLTHLTEGKIFLCAGKGWSLDVELPERVQEEIFVGPHPAGLVGTHIHRLAPVGRKRTVWHIGYQDVIAIGHLFRHGTLNVDRVISVAGPMVKAPALVQTRIGASIEELTRDALHTNADNEVRIISGSVLFGHQANAEPFAFLNRYDQQISCVAEDRERVFMGWLSPGLSKFSTVRAFMSRWFPGKRKFALTTTTHGSHRAMVPIGMFERVMPLDIFPTFLLRSLLMNDLERAEQLGCLELHEEDLALCSFVSPGKEDYGKALRGVLQEIWREG